MDAVSKVATEFFPLEKMAKISYRMLDLAKVLHESFPSHLVILSSQIKNLVLGIESTRFFCVSFPVFFPKNGSFFHARTYVQCAEKICITSHLAFKTLFGADYVGLIRLGTIGTYAIGNLSVFKWALETTVLMYNFFGAWDGINSLIKAESNLAVANKKLKKWDLRKTLERLPASCDRMINKQRKWGIIKTNLQIDRNRAAFKIAATVSKFILIFFATTLAVINVWTIPFQVSVLSLGTLSDAIGLSGFFYQQYKLPLVG